ncbi:Vps53-like protein [Xylaria digitata]|nr:Vps53-like protein [Xylaria digitata]
MNGNAVGSLSLDAADYDPVQHLNLLFPHPSTVSSIRSLSSTLNSEQDALSTDIAARQTAQAYGPGSSLERMQSAQAELGELFRKIETVRARAIQAEQNITSMTADIKRLDGTKRNLTLSMTALKRLQMLTTAYEQLRGLAKTRQYRECASLLQAVIQLMRHFNSYRSIDQIATLSRGVGEIQRELLEQVCEDFEIAFAKGEIGGRKPTLVEACGVMDALGDTARARLITWYVNTELREYRQVFRGNDEAGSLDNIGRRYAWFKRMMKGYEEEHASIFPPHWRVGETLAMAFCDGTRDDYKGILEKSMRKVDGAKIDVNLLLSCLQETMDFEQSIERRFSNEPRASIDTLSSADERIQSFNGSISVAFEPYLSLWVESQDKALMAMIPKYKAQPLLPADEEFSPQAVISSAIELFHFYKLMLSQCAKLSTSERLLDLAKTLAKYLDEYAQQVLLAILQQPAQTAASIQDIVLVMNTADFWHTNTSQLEENIKKRIDSELVSRVDLTSQADAFLGVASTAVLALVNKVEADCDGAWREMKNTNWSKMESVGDQSSYVGELVSHVNAKTEEILAIVAKPQYARAFADNLVEHIANTYITNIVRCRPVSEVGAEQMLLDKYVLTKAFENLLSYHNSSSSTPSQPSASFVKRVNNTMTRIDPLLKTLQVRPSPPEGLVQAYLIHIGDRSDTNFKKILELKGVRKTDQPHLVELFGIHRDAAPSTGGNKLVAQSPLLTPLLMTSGLGSSGLVGGLNHAAVAATPARFDPTSLGEKLLSAARDGVERIGTPSGGQMQGAAGGSGNGSSSTVGGQNAASINENLRNFGKFFRRDIAISGLGARFGKRDISGSGAGSAE